MKTKQYAIIAAILGIALVTSGGAGAQPVAQVERGSGQQVSGMETPATHQDFQDVPASDPFFSFLRRIYAAGIVGGYPCGGPGEPCVGPENLPYYRPTNDVTRAQMSKFVDLARTQPGIRIDTSSSIYPIYARTTASNGQAVVANAPNGYGVLASSTIGVGVEGNSTSGPGVFGFSDSGNGVLGRSASNTGVRGSSTSGTGVEGQSSTGYAGRFVGNVQVTGNLSKGGGSFKIDHPLDPTNKYLYHSFVESPDMMNIYNGNTATDAKGEAVVTLPDWFEALNKDFRYQLTIMGDQFAQARVSSKIKNNRFTIMTDKPNVEVSWQVTGIRQDAYANAHRIPVEEVKPEAERGLYLHPDAYGQPESKRIGAQPEPDR